MPPAAPTDVDIIRTAEKLPTAPRLLVRLGPLMNDPGADADEVVRLLRQDPALVAQVIRIANSAAYCPPEPIGSLERALSFVGFSEVHRLIGAIAAAQMAEQKMTLYPVDGTKLRLHTLYVAVLMQELAKFAGESPYRCYTVGLLRTIGMMVLERLAPEGAVPFAQSGERQLDIWEQRTFGITNPEVAEKVLIHWRLPPETAEAIRHHYRPGRLHNPIIHLLKIAASAGNDWFYGIPGEQDYWRIEPENFEKAGMAVSDFQRACEKARKAYEKLKVAIG